MLFMMLLLRLSRASSGSEKEGLTGAGMWGGTGRGGGGGSGRHTGGGSGTNGGGGSGSHPGGCSCSLGGGGTGGGITAGDARVLFTNFDFRAPFGTLPNLSRTNLLTTSVCSSRSRFISCTLSVVSRAGVGLTGESEPELRLMDTESSKLLVGESVLRDVEGWKVSLAERHTAGEYRRMGLGPLNGLCDGYLTLGVSGTSGGEISELSVSTILSFSNGGEISDTLKLSILFSNCGSELSSTRTLSL